MKLDHIQSQPNVNPVSKTFYAPKQCFEEHTLSSSISPSKTFLEDWVGFIQNIFLWPIHGQLILMHQILFLCLFPLVFPILILSEILHMLLNFLTCGYYSKHAFLQPQYSLKAPTSSEKAFLEKIIATHGSKNLSIEHQTNLLHIFHSYLSHANTCNSNKKNEYVQVLAKIHIDGKTIVFTYTPDKENTRELLQSYLQYISLHAKEDSVIKHTFICLDYTYFIGLLRTEIKTDTIKYNLKPEEDAEPISCLSSFASSIHSFLFPKSIYRET